MKNFLTSAHGKLFITTFLLSILTVFITFEFAIQLSSFGVELAKAALGIILFWAFDNYAMREIDTITELKKGNIAYAIFMLSLALIVAAAILGS